MSDKEYRRNYYRRRYREDPEHRRRVINSNIKYQKKKRREKIIALCGRLVEGCEACNRKLKFFKGRHQSGTPYERTNIDLHHIISDARGNETETNTAMLCKSCHSRANYIGLYFGITDKEKLLQIIMDLNRNPRPTKEALLYVVRQSLDSQ